MGLFDWIEKRREAARRREEEEEQKLLAEAAEKKKIAAQHAQAQEQAQQEEVARLAAEKAMQRAEALKRLPEHASIVLETYALLNAGRRSEAERLSNASLVERLVYCTRLLGAERAVEFICIAPYWGQLICEDKQRFSDFLRLLHISEAAGKMVEYYDYMISEVIPAHVRAIIEKASTSSSLDAEGLDWEQTSLLLGYQPEKRAIGHEGEGNILTVAPPGSGKGQCHVLPNILAYDGPMVILDIKKSENFTISKAASKSLIPSHLKGGEFLGHFPMYKFDPADPDNSVIYNPLEFLPKSLDLLWSAAGRMAEWLCVPSTSKDTYFDDRARQWTRGLIAAVVIMSKDSPEPPSVGQIVDFVFDVPEDQDKFLAGVALLDEVPIANFAKNLLGTSVKERSATMNTIARSLEPWQDPIIRRLTSGKSTWSPQNLLMPEKIGVSYEVRQSPWDDGITLSICQYADKYCYWFPRLFICMPAGDVRSATSVVRVLIGQHTDALIERDHSRDDPPIVFMLDEFPQLGHMESIMRGVEMGRSAGLKFWFFAQDLQQIGRSYKPEDEAVILGSCAVQCFMNISTPETAQAVSQRLGVTRSVLAGTSRPLIPPEELLNSPKWKSKILCLRRQEAPLVLEKRMFKDMF